MTRKIAGPPNTSPFTIGIGASAGGLDAINNLFENMPDNTGFSFIIIQHISPDHKSLMAELVRKHTRMHVKEAENDLEVEPDHIYVIPSRKLMTIREGRLCLYEKEKNRLPNNAIDVFFESLANEKNSMAVGIILSGTGSDGTKGAGIIKEKGGTVIVQDPVTAAFDGMPNSAIAAGLGDLVSAPEAIAQDLIDLLNDSPQIKAFHASGHKDEYLIRNLLAQIKDDTGLDFTHYKRPTILRRLAKRLSELNISSIKTYNDYISLHPEEISVISKEFLINVSSFFRDKEAFEILKNRVIPSIMNSKTDGGAVKAWCVACSNGEEAYSMAILFREWMDKNSNKIIPVKIFATDIDRDALETANRGIYPKSILQDMPGEKIAKYFVPEGSSYRIHPEIRKMVVFSYHDILKDPPFGRMDLISCRNMLIYINAEQQKEIQRKLHFALNLDGYLFLGPSENIGLLKNVVEETDRKWKIYKCVSKSRLEEYDKFFVPLEKKLASLPQTRQKNPLNHIPELFNETLLEGHRFAGLFVTPELEVKQATGNYKRFIEFPETGFDFSLLKMVGPELGIALSVSVGKSLREQKVVITNGVKAKKDGVEYSVNIIIKPYLQLKDFQVPFLFISFEEAQLATEFQKNILHTGSFEGEQKAAELEHELNETRANMQLLLEEVETSNEELRSINEEAISTNEELQSTNEELQSLNEELHTVSAEHQLKIKELIELNDDLNNYFNNSDIGQILIDHDLIIRKFTPSVGKMINLIDTDLNRSIIDITTKIRNIDFVSDIREVIKSGMGSEKEITVNAGTVYLMRIAPYVRQDHSTDGVVISFVNVTEIKRLNSIVHAIFDSSPYGISAKTAIRNANGEIDDFEFIAANKACEDLYGMPVDKLVGLKFKSYASYRQEYFELYKKVVITGEPLHFEVFDTRVNKWFEVNVAKMLDGIVSAVTDISDRKKSEKLIQQSFESLKITSGKLAETNNQLEQSNLDLMQFASIASHDLKEPLRKIETFGNLLNEKVKSRLEDKELKYLEKIIGASNRMQVLVEDVLTFSKLSNNELPLVRVNLNHILHRIVDDLEITIRDKNAEMMLGELPEINGVPGQMHQLFQNLISNALKFNDKTHPIVAIQEITIPSKYIREFSINPDDYHCISIKDNGIGIEEQYSEKIFGIFQRLNGNRYQGTGIGLAVCKKIAENMKGHLVMESIPGKGTEFFIIIPK